VVADREYANSFHQAITRTSNFRLLSDVSTIGVDFQFTVVDSFNEMERTMNSTWKRTCISRDRSQKCKEMMRPRAAKAEGRRDVHVGEGLPQAKSQGKKTTKETNHRGRGRHPEEGEAPKVATKKEAADLPNPKHDRKRRIRTRKEPNAGS